MLIPSKATVSKADPKMVVRAEGMFYWSDRGEKLIRQSSAETARQKGTGAVVAAMLPKVLGRTTLSTRPELCDRVRARLLATDPRGVAASLLGMKDRVDSTPTLATITVPTLVVVGAEDALTGPAVAREMAEAIPDARVAEIARALDQGQRLARRPKLSEDLSRFREESRTEA